MSESAADKRKQPVRFLKYQDLEEWRKDNEYIQQGYHPLTGSWLRSWLSLLGRPHSETVNIVSHLLGAVVAAACFVYTYRHLALPQWFDEHPPHLKDVQRRLVDLIYPFPSQSTSITYIDSWAFSSFYVAAFLCFACSASFHTSLLHSKSVNEYFHKLDYVGIVFLITGTYYPALYYGFYCEPFWQVFYMAGVTLFGATTAYFVLSPGYTTPAYRRVRTFLFIGLGLSGVVPVMHKLILEGHQRANKALGLDWLLVGGAFYIAGALLYAERMPERLAPGRFDILGASHQIFHVCCLLAALAHYVAICQAHHYHHFVAESRCTVYEQFLRRVFGDKAT